MEKFRKSYEYGTYKVYLIEYMKRIGNTALECKYKTMAHM